MVDTTVKVRTETRDRIKRLGAELHLSADEVVSSALAELERARLWARWQQAYDAMTVEQQDSYRDDQGEYDRTLRDGLDASW